ncbi:hypothetical protein SAMN05421823_109251 [Catalinimonas alkaloidigena]|uniref:Por secretion system C-terminal sorting domain-containing protein n=1 Tax=Catalinimonas alkaloidigena TaxID=1075417 RepID=A0A1G9PNF6_9BACT|nr:hypothetical protein [Catalinimonas alkaloidigena]SDM00402.1 hypothetical protein SAMN05421823_109251 [Catalinimonas alkaloidigena]
MKLLYSPLVAGLLSATLWLQSFYLFAQPRLPTSQYVPDKGYWEVSVNPKGRYTTVAFFDQDRQLLYEEKLWGQYIDLTEKNRAHLDALLAQMLQQHLVANAVKTKALQQLPLRSLRTLPAEALRNEVAATKQNLEAAERPVDLSMVVRKGPAVLQVFMKNPLQRMVFLQLRNDKGKVFYEENSRQVAYNRRFQLADLPDGTYHFVVKAKGKRLQRVMFMEAGQLHLLSEELPPPTEPHYADYLQKEALGEAQIK